MGAWFEFFITVTVRFVGGFIIAGLLAYVIGFREVMREISESRIPYGYIIFWGVIGGVICVCTTPRRMRPWTKA